MAFGLYDTLYGTVFIEALKALCDTNSTGQSATNLSQCACTAPSIWITGNCVTLTDAICQALANSTVDTTNSQACSCTAPYVFDTFYATCRIDCTQASTLSNGTQFEYDSCYCTAANTAWNYTGNTCSLYIDCSKATTNSNGTNVNASACYCNSGFVFNSTLLACQLDCTKATTNSNGTNVNNSACYCNSGFVFNSTLLACVRDCGSVSEV
jgi:hypothetical protein